MCVVLVSTNRQDIALSLHGEGELKARLAAEAGFNQAIQYMRSHSDWEQKFSQPFVGALASGAEWRAEVKPYDGGLALPHPYLHLKGTGIFKSVRVEKNSIVEEFRLGDTFAQKGDKPHLFAIGKVCPLMKEAALLMLGPSFQWRPIQAPQDITVPTLGCDGGPLAGLRSLDSSPAGPAYSDYSAVAGNFGFYNYVFGEVGTMPKCPKLVTLDIQGSTMTWKPQPIVSSLSKVIQATIDDNPNGQPRIETVNTPTGPLPVDVSDHKGPMMDWWELTQNRVMSDETAVYCLARHHIWLGTHAKNIITMEAGYAVNSGFRYPGVLQSATGVLKFDLQARVWTPLCDPIRADLGSWKIQVTSQVEPNAVSATLTGRSVYATDSKNSNNIAVANPNGWSVKDSSPSGLTVLFGRNDRINPLVVESDMNNNRHFNIRGEVKVEKSLPAVVPGVTTLIGSNDGRQFEKRVAIAEQNYDWSLHPTITDNVSALGETYSIGRLNYFSSPVVMDPVTVPPITPSMLQASVLLHYDGHFWQLWPQGAQAAVWDPDRYLSFPDQGPTVEDTAHTQYALSRLVGAAGYKTSVNLMRRYAPIVFY